MQTFQWIPDSILALALRGLIVGLVLGFIPLALGFLKKRRRLGVYGLFSSSVGGALLTGIFSMLIVIVFVWLILRKSKMHADEVAGAASESEKSETVNSDSEMS